MREYLEEVGILGEMEKIQVYHAGEFTESKRGFELLNVENPINKVGLENLVTGISLLILDG